MTTRNFRLIAVFVFILSAIGLALIAARFDPVEASGGVKFLLFASLFLSIWGGGAFVFSFLGRPRFTYSYRRGFLLALYLASLVIIERFADLSVISIVILSIVFIAVELIWVYLFNRQQ
jgi:hypothetical protein